MSGPGLPVAERRTLVPEALVGGFILLLVVRGSLAPIFDRPVLQTWSTVFVSLVVQAVPFLVLGVVLSGAVAAFLPGAVLARLLSGSPAVTVPAAGLAGALLPGCECGSVPIAGRLGSRGVPLSAALAFMLSAPAINPVVLVATAVAFPGQPEMVAARFAASLATAVVMGWAWSRFGRPEWVCLRLSHGHEAPRRAVFAASARHDFLHAGGFLVLGAVLAATFQVVVPRSVTDTLGGTGPAAVVVLGLLAVVLAVCSEADSFVAASLTSFSRTAQLAFMTVGPAVDVKLVALQTGTFGPAFAVRFAPLTFFVALACAGLASWTLL